MAIVVRRARQKAKLFASRHPDARVIGKDANKRIKLLFQGVATFAVEIKGEDDVRVGVGRGGVNKGVGAAMGTFVGGVPEERGRWVYSCSHLREQKSRSTNANLTTLPLQTRHFFA